MLRRTLGLGLALLAPALLPNCVAYSSGIELAVRLDAERATWRFETEEGHWVQLQEAELSIADLQLLPCEESTLAASLVDTLRVGAASALGPRRASAHANTGEASDAIVDLVHAGPSYELTTLMPAPGRYCALVVELAPTDVLDESGAWIEAPGMHFAGVLMSADEESSLSFDVTESARTLVLPFADALELADPGAGSLTLALDQRRLFDGCRLDTESDELMRQIVANLQSQLSPSSPSL